MLSRATIESRLEAVQAGEGSEVGAKIHLVVGAQFGSEAKGAVAAFLSKEIEGPVIGVRVGGPNAGHTVIGLCPSECVEHGKELRNAGVHPWRLRQIPVMAVSRPDSALYIAAGSEIDIDVLLNEVDLLDSAGYAVSPRLTIDRHATVIEDGHKFAEQDSDLNSRLGSTAKGIGAARADRIMRRARRVSDWTWDESDEIDRSMTHIQSSWVGDTTYKLQRAMETAGTSIIIEGTQGYGLGLHTSYYPFVTSGDCRGVDLLAQCGISPWAAPNVEVHTWLVMRPNPIRVAGNSGPLAGETTWGELGLPEELTTVTQRTRRVGRWDPDLVRDAIDANGGIGPRMHLVLTMLDHLVPAIRGASSMNDLDADTVEQAQERVLTIENTLPYGSRIGLAGTGPGSMMWYRADDLGAVKSQDPFRELKAMMSSVVQVFGVQPREVFHEIENRLESTDELTNWWLGVAQDEVKPMVDKALEYGGKGAAIDLIEIGRDLGRLAGHKDISDLDATELGIYFYLRGKFGRWQAAVLEGRKVSDDTLLDIGVYVRMAQRARAVGGWPYAPEEE